MSFFVRIAVFCRTFRKTSEVEYGPGGINLLKKAYFSLFRINTFVIYCFNDDGSLLRGDVPGMVTIEDFSRLDKYRCRKDIPKELCCDRTHPVSSCCIIEAEEGLAYIHWVYTSNDYSRFINLGKHVAEINNVLTLPEFRGRNLAAKALRKSAMDLKDKGYSKVVAAIHDQNIASIKAFARAGFVEIGKVRTIGPFNTKVVFS